MTVSFPGSDVLFGTASSTAVPGLTPENAPASQAAQENPYQQSYDQIEIWSGTYLERAALFGAPPIAQYTEGSTVGGFAGLSSLLAQIHTGLEAGVYGGGTGSTIDSYA